MSKNIKPQYVRKYRVNYAEFLTFLEEDHRLGGCCRQTASIRRSVQTAKTFIALATFTNYLDVTDCYKALAYKKSKDGDYGDEKKSPLCAFQVDCPMPPSMNPIPEIVYKALTRLGRNGVFDIREAFAQLRNFLVHQDLPPQYENLTIIDRAAIALYTLQINGFEQKYLLSVYGLLNLASRSDDTTIKSNASLLFDLVMTAMRKLPVVTRDVVRCYDAKFLQGARGPMIKDILSNEGRVFVFGSLTSTSNDLKVARDKYLPDPEDKSKVYHGPGTLMQIQDGRGIILDDVAYLGKSESEVLILPRTAFVVVKPLHVGPNGRDSEVILKYWSGAVPDDVQVI